MKNPLIIIVIVVVLAVAGVGVFNLSQKSTTQPEAIINDHKGMDKDEHDPSTRSASSGQAGSGQDMMMDGKNGSRYVVYSKTALDN